MPVNLLSAGGGTTTLTTASSASNFTVTIPASTGTAAVLDGSNNLSVAGNLSFNSGFGSAAIAYGCRAWVKFSLTGAISGSGNVSSVTDTNTAFKSINLINAMPDTNYVTAICQNQSTGAAYAATMTQIASSTASRVDIYNVNELTDVTGWMLSVIR
jgi:hypothetical protein